MVVTQRTDYPELNSQVQEIWDHNARWWDSNMAEGNTWHLTLIAPAVERLLNVQPGERVLDLACGNRQFSRRLAQLGARVVACDCSPSFLECARLRATMNAELIEYQLIDLTNEEQLAGFGMSEFDGVVCNMALMDIAVITPLLRTVRRTLRSGGRFVFSIPHPCFHTTGTTLVAEREESETNVSNTYSVKIRQYRTLRPQKGIGIVSQPEAHYYFHRTLGTLMTACFDAGLVLDGLEERGFDPAPEPKPGLGFEQCTEVPPILVARLR